VYNNLQLKGNEVLSRFDRHKVPEYLDMPSAEAEELIRVVDVSGYALSREGLESIEIDEEGSILINGLAQAKLLIECVQRNTALSVSSLEARRLANARIQEYRLPQMSPDQSLRSDAFATECHRRIELAPEITAHISKLFNLEEQNS
jgi:hypothetical protein